VSNYSDLPEPRPDWTRLDFECAFYAVKTQLLDALESRDKSESLCSEIAARCADAGAALAAAREENAELQIYRDCWIEQNATALKHAKRLGRKRAGLPDDLVALRARASDSDRVERVARWFADTRMPLEGGESDVIDLDHCEELARAVLAAADGEGVKP
jgi:hypothetical protein